MVSRSKWLLVLAFGVAVTVTGTSHAHWFHHHRHHQQQVVYMYPAYATTVMQAPAPQASLADLLIPILIDRIGQGRNEPPSRPTSTDVTGVRADIKKMQEDLAAFRKETQEATENLAAVARTHGELIASIRKDLSATKPSAELNELLEEVKKLNTYHGEDTTANWIDKVEAAVESSEVPAATKTKLNAAIAELKKALVK